MNCQEIHNYFENPGNAPLASQNATLAEHIAACESCRCFVEQQEELAASLHLLREAVAQPSASLDAAVVTAYRKQIAEQASSGPRTRRRFPLAVLGGSLAIAAGVLVIVMLPTIRRAVVTAERSPAAPPTAAAASDTAEPGIPAATPPLPTASRLRATRPTTSAMKRMPRRAKASSLLPGRNAAETPSASAAIQLPAGFRSLMYCDELSCLGGLEVIRVQLPSFVADPGVMARGTNGFVYADVLVGADGIARGIRIVQ